MAIRATRDASRSRAAPTGRNWYPPRPVSAASFAAVLESIRPWISKALLDGPGWERVISFARNMPADAASCKFGFEHRLQVPSADADLSVGIWRNSPFAQHIVSGARTVEADPVERAFAQALLESERKGSLLSRTFGGAIVEYDIAANRGTRTPGIFLIGPRFWEPTSRGFTNPGLMTAAIAAAPGWPECDGQRRVVERLFDSLPEGVFVSGVGAFPSRASRAIRLLVAGVQAPCLPTFLGQLDWPGSPDSVADALSGFSEFAPKVTAALEVGEHCLLPRLGLELCPSVGSRDRIDCSTQVWHRFIDRLEERGLCLSAKAAGLRHCAHVKPVSDPASGWRAFTGINHFKIALEGDRVEAKAYVFFDPRPLLTTADLVLLFG